MEKSCISIMTASFPTLVASVTPMCTSAKRMPTTK